MIRRAVEACAVLAGTVVRITRRPFRSALRAAPGLVGAAAIAIGIGQVAGHYAAGLAWWVALGVGGVFVLWFGAEVNRVPPVPPADLGRVVTT